MLAPKSMLVPENLYEILASVPKGRWVALSEDQTHVVAYDPDLSKVFKMAEAAGEKDPVITRVPEDDFHWFL
jgi:hypothetical protein